MQAVVISIGDELVLGQSVDTNSASVSERLSGLGIFTVYHQTVADELGAIVGAIREACASAGLVIVTGGLGPTEDDLTRAAMAEVLGVKLVEDGESLEAIREFFAKRGRVMPESNRVQAMLPAGAIAIPNARGTAPGIEAKVGKAVVYVMPGVPGEMKEMFEGYVLPRVKEVKGSGGVILTTKINAFGLGESTIGEKLGRLMDRARNPKVGTTVAGGIVSVRVRSEFEEAERAARELEETAREVEKLIGPVVFGRDSRTLQEAVIGLLRERKMTVATAESCTGGLVGRMLTDVAGSSQVYRGGWITYSNEMKISELGVGAELLNKEGAVSGATAGAMAGGALRRSGADLAVAVTGIAGPTLASEGGTEEKPVGTVWIGLAGWRSERGERGGEAWTKRYRCLFVGERETVRDLAARCALQMMRFEVIGEAADVIMWVKEEQR